MDNWRRQTTANYAGYGDPRSRSMRRKPPRGVNNGQPTVPTVPNWEKRFCKIVGNMDWETFVDKKRFVHLYDNVSKWNDSAGEEAFYNAKKRFLAKVNGWPCDIPLPSPDLYIDKVDWDAKADEDPLLELGYDESLVNHEPVVIFGDTLIRNLGLSPAGWGDEDEKCNKPVDLGMSPAGWGDEDEKFNKPVDSYWDNYHDQMPSNQGVSPAGWGDEDEKCNKAVDSSWDNYYDQIPVEIKETAYENDCYVGPDYHNANAGDTGWGDDNWLKMEGTRKNDFPGAWQVNNNNTWVNKNYGQQCYDSSTFKDTGWDDDWLKMEGTAGKSNAPGTWQVNNNWGNKNSGQHHKARYESPRFVESNTYCNKGRYKWRSGSNYGKREAIVN